MDRPIRESAADLPPGIVIGAIARDGEHIAPRGDTVVEAGDHVIVFANADAVTEVAEKL